MQTSVQTSGQPKLTIRVPVVYLRRGLAKQAYRQAFTVGYHLALGYIERGEQVDNGRFPEALPEFRGHSVAERAWRDGCVAGAVSATRDEAFARDMLETAAFEMDALELTEAGADALQPAGGAAAPTQAELDAQMDEARRESRSAMTAVVIACGGAALVFVALVLWIWLVHASRPY